MAALDPDETFDLAIGVFLLNYAASRRQLLDQHGSRPGTLWRLSKVRSVAIDDSRPARIEGDVITAHLAGRDGAEVCLSNYYLSPATYESAFAEAGLREFSWEALSVPEAGLRAYPAGYWDALLAAPLIVGMQARKQL